MQANSKKRKSFTGYLLPPFQPQLTNYPSTASCQHLGNYSVEGCPSSFYVYVVDQQLLKKLGKNPGELLAKMTRMENENNPLLTGKRLKYM